MRYHYNVKTVTIPAGGTITVDYGPESQDNVSENLALWLQGGNVAYVINYNGAESVASANYVGPVAKKVFTEAGPIAISTTYPSVALTGAAGVKVVVSWLGLIRQIGG